LSAWFISQQLSPDEAIALMGCATAQLIRVLPRIAPVCWKALLLPCVARRTAGIDD